MDFGKCQKTIAHNGKVLAMFPENFKAIGQGVQDLSSGNQNGGRKKNEKKKNEKMNQGSRWLTDHSRSWDIKLHIVAKITIPWPYNFRFGINK